MRDDDLIVPPSNLEAERCVLGSIVLDPAALAEVAPILQGPGAFYSAGHGTIYAAMLTLSERGVPADHVTLKAELVRRGKLADVGGVDELREIIEAPPSSANAVYYAKIVSGLASVRSVREAALRIVKAIDAANLNADEVRDLGSREIAKAVERAGTSDSRWVFDLANEEQARLDDTSPDPVIESGLERLDYMLGGGWRPGQLVILAARPGVGKTSLAMQFARAAQGQGALVITLEMSAAELVRLLLSQRAEVGSSKIRSRHLSAKDRGAVRNAGSSFEVARIWVNDSARTLTDILSQARRARAKDGIGLLIVDYLQLVDPGKDRREENRAEAVGRLSRGLKLLARDAGISVIALAQFNRALESREGHKPRLSDLRESGSIEQDADIVIAIHREVVPNESKPEMSKEGELILLKHRGGPVGSIPVSFAGDTQTFSQRNGGGR